jgi:2-C-methyl-D-erythritol 4-phosphate cytidylyltransferase
MQYSALIPAAGTGSRMKASVPKVLLDVGCPDAASVAHVSSSILGRTLAAFCGDAACLRIVICFPVEWATEFERYREVDPRIVLVSGGATRQESVARGVEALCALSDGKSDEVVLVHDAARCNVSYPLIRRVVEGVFSLGAVTAALPVADAVCRATDAGTVLQYVDRSNLFSIQTPQGFYLKDIARAHAEAAKNNVAALDDAALVASLREVHVVLGDPLNIKATHPHDREVLRRIAAGAT